MKTSISENSRKVPDQVFEQVVEQADLAVSITDAGANILYVNPAFSRITGYSAAEAIGKNQSMLSHKVTPAEVYRHLWTQLTAGGSWFGRLINRRRDGGKYLAELSISPVLDDRGQTLYFLGLHRDVTELHRLECEVGNQKALIESVVDAAPVAMALLDGERKIVLDNHEYKKLMADLGMSEPATLILEAVQAELGHDFGVARAGSHAFLNQEIRIDRPSRHGPRWFSCSAIWVKRDDGDADSFFGHRNSVFLLLAAMEVTEQRVQQEKSRMAALQAMLAEEGRIDALRETLAAAVFQLQGPINVMTSVMATMERRGAAMAADQALAQALLAAQDALATLGNAMPGHSEEAPTAVNLNEAVHDVLELATVRMLAAGVSVGWRPQAVLPAIHGYPNRLRAMLKALVDNAIEAMNVKAWSVRELSLSSRSLPESVEIVIEDSGPGIPAGVRWKVFEPFFTTKKDGGHLGTGLSSALQIVQDHAGSIELDPAESGGCRVRILLPLRRP